MSRLFGPIRQNGYVVRDIEAAMAHWIDVLQVGPVVLHRPRARPTGSAIAARTLPWR